MIGPTSVTARGDTRPPAAEWNDLTAYQKNAVVRERFGLPQQPQWAAWVHNVGAALELAEGRCVSIKFIRQETNPDPIVSSLAKDRVWVAEIATNDGRVFAAEAKEMAEALCLAMLKSVEETTTELKGTED